MEKEIVRILIRNRAIKVGDLFVQDINLGLRSRCKTFPKLVNALDEARYILDKLEGEKYIEIKRNNNPGGEGSNFFEGLSVDLRDNDSEITASKLHWFVNDIKEIYCWEIITKSGLISYITNNYHTINEINWVRTRNLSLLVAIITAVFTSILTAALSSNGNLIFLFCRSL